jgi:hypothetical protein
MKWTVAMIVVVVRVTGLCRADDARRGSDNRGRCFARDGEVSRYRSVCVPANPRRDPKAVADAMRQTGFHSVELAMDIDRDAILKALRAFRDQADQSDWALICFAGDGIEINRANYPIPIDAKLLDDRDVKAETVSWNCWTRLAARRRSGCSFSTPAASIHSTTPCDAGWRRTAALTGGLRHRARRNPGRWSSIPRNGEVAADDVDHVNSPFARSFVAELKAPGREVRRLFDNSRRRSECDQQSSVALHLWRAVRAEGFLFRGEEVE